MNDECIERCYICLENLYDVSGNLKCGCFNRYHTNCLETWLLIQNECPTCKKKINEIKNNNRDEDENSDDEDFELELNDNNIFYNPLVYFISVYIIYLYYIFYLIIYYLYLF